MREKAFSVFSLILTVRFNLVSIWCTNYRLKSLFFLCNKSGNPKLMGLERAGYRKVASGKFSLPRRDSVAEQVPLSAPITGSKACFFCAIPKQNSNSIIYFQSTKSVQPTIVNCFYKFEQVSIVQNNSSFYHQKQKFLSINYNNYLCFQLLLSQLLKQTFYNLNFYLQLVQNVQ